MRKAGKQEKTEEAERPPTRQQIKIQSHEEQ
jgi:hypothetical protein